MSLDPVELVEYHLLVSQIIFGAGYLMLVYDWIVCLSRESRYIWQAKMSWIKTLYFFCRYWPLSTVPYILWAYTVPHTLSECQRIFRIPVAIATWNQLGAEAVLLARTVAFLGNKWPVRIVLAGCLIATVAYQNWVVFGPMILIPFMGDQKHGVCLPTSPGGEIFGFFFSSLCFDTLVTALMLYRVFRLRREAGEFSRSPLVQLFVSEGLWYFVLASIANAVNAAMFLQKDKSLQATAVPFSNMLPPLLACRLILDLREHGTTEGNAWLSTGKGNLGFYIPRFIYRSQPPTAGNNYLSTIRFQNAAPPAGGDVPVVFTSVSTASETTSRPSDVQFVNAHGVGPKRSFKTPSAAPPSAYKGKDVVFGGERDGFGVAPPAKPDVDEVDLSVAGSELDLAYQKPVRGQDESR